MRGTELLYAMQFVDAAYINAAEHPTQPKRRFSKTLSILAACLSLCFIITCLILHPQQNTFAIVAYAAETARDGSVALYETDLSGSSSTLGGYYDGETLYLALGLQYRGHNLKNVRFSASEGIFATQRKDTFADIHPLSIARNAIFILPPTAFDISGTTLTLDSKNSTDFLVFWGTDPKTFPEEFTIRAVATFTDGQTQNLEIPINLRDNPLVTEVRKKPWPYLYFQFSL